MQPLMVGRAGPGGTVPTRDIVDWGKTHVAFLRGFAEFHFGIPCAGWLRAVMNRIDPVCSGTV